MTATELWEEVEQVENTLGKEEFLEELKRAMDTDELEDLTAFICRMHGIETKCRERG